MAMRKARSDVTGMALHPPVTSVVAKPTPMTIYAQNSVLAFLVEI